MQCINCEAKWETKENTVIAKCPFCGENPTVKKAKQKTFDNSKQALDAIYKQFGADILLGKLSAYIADFAPSLSMAEKRLVNSVNDFGASKALKESVNGSQEDKERAVKVAVNIMTEAFVAPEMAVNIIYEFTDALEWKIGKQAVQTPAEESKKSTSSTVKKSGASGPLIDLEKEFEKAKALRKKANYEEDEKKSWMHNQEAADIFKILAEKDHVKAQYELGYCYMHGLGVNEDKIKAFELIKKAAEQDYNIALVFLAGFYESDKNYSKALECYNKAAELGDDNAYFSLGKAYEEGLLGVTVNYVRAAEYYQKITVELIAELAKRKLDNLKKQGKI